MKKLRILIVDDDVANIEAAKIAAQEFTQHEFIFMTSANKAFDHIQDFDAIITDLFFPEKPSDSMMEIYEEMQTKIMKNERHSLDRLEKNISIIRNGSTLLRMNEPLNFPEFPLGISIMLKAKSFWNNGFVKKFCLVSDIHCHGSADGKIILLPLINPLRADDIENDGNGSLYYMGSNRIPRHEGKCGKINPLIWEKAIHCILAQ